MPRKGEPKPTALEIARRRYRIEELYIQGWTQHRIADEIGYTAAQVSIDLKIVQEEWKRRYAGERQEFIAAQLARIDKLERTYWEAWDASLTERVRKTQAMTNAQDGRRKKNSSRGTVVKEERDGDPRFLAGIQWCIERRCQILGLDAPKKQELSGPEGGPIKMQQDVNELRKLPSDELIRLYREKIRAPR